MAQCIWIASYPFIRSILPFLITPSNSQRPWIASSFRMVSHCCCLLWLWAPYAPWYKRRRCPTSSNLPLPAVWIQIWREDLKFENNNRSYPHPIAPSIFCWRSNDSTMPSSSYGAIDNGSSKKLDVVAEELPLVAKIKKGIVSPSSTDDNGTSSKKKKGHTIIHYIVYAIINVIIALPALYGFSSVIFNHPIFQPHVAALSKLVIFSSFMHQLGFVLFSGLDFAIGTVQVRSEPKKRLHRVFCSYLLHRTLTYIYSYCFLSYPFISYQDAGLIFLSAMANNIAESILDKGGSVEEVISTTLVILSLGTASMGVVLALLGKYQLLDIVSYLPMPVSCD